MASLTTLLQDIIMIMKTTAVSHSYKTKTSLCEQIQHAAHFRQRGPEFISTSHSLLLGASILELFLANKSTVF